MVTISGRDFCYDISSQESLWEEGSAMWNNIDEELRDQLVVITIGEYGGYVYRASRLEGDAGKHLSSSNLEGLLTLRNLYGSLKMLSRADIESPLIPYIRAGEVVGTIQRLLDIRGLAALVIWIKFTVGLRVSGIDVVEDLERGVPMFIALYLEDCGWEDWKILSRAVKRQLIEEGFEDIAGRVSIVCKQAFKTRRS